MEEKQSSSGAPGLELYGTLLGRIEWQNDGPRANGKAPQVGRGTIALNDLFAAIAMEQQQNHH
jgi:hypothetical protein